MFVQIFCFGVLFYFGDRVIWLWTIQDPPIVYAFGLTVFSVSGLLYLATIHIIQFIRESKIVSISAEGLYLKNGALYRFDDAQSILPGGLMGFEIKFRDGQKYRPIYLNNETATQIFLLIKHYIETSPKKSALIENINAHLKKRHNKDAYLVIFFSTIMIAFPLLPSLNLKYPIFIVAFGLLPLGYGLFKLRQSPKTFDQLQGRSRMGH